MLQLLHRLQIADVFSLYSILNVIEKQKINVTNDARFVTFFANVFINVRQSYCARYN